MRFIVVTEARDDFNTATELADRVLLNEIDWLDEHLESQRQWVGEEAPGLHLAWKTVSYRAREVGIKVHGHFDNEAALPDARAARRAILYVLKFHNPVDAILLIRDLDDQHDRRRGLEQARSADSSGIPIVIGAAKCERECWVICGFDPENEAEMHLLGLETQQLGSNPCLRSHELTAGKNDQALRSPKRVLKALTADNWERRQKCWRITSLNILRQRGTENGLTSYLDEIRQHLAPLITSRKTSP